MLFDSSHIDIITKRPSQISFLYNCFSRKCEYVSPSFAQIWGNYLKEYSQNDFKSLALLIFKDDRDEIINAFAKCIVSTCSDQLEFRVVLSDGAEKTIQCNISSHTNSDGKMEWIGGTLEDYTVQKENQNLSNQYSANKNSLLQILSHDLAGNLGIIGNLVSLIKSKNIDYVKLEGYSDIIQNLCSASLNLINDFTNREFLDSARLQLNVGKIDLVERTRGVINTYINAKNLISKRFDLHSSSDEIMVYIDDIKFMQCINNLISNAIKFSPDDDTIIIKLEDKGNTLLVSVSDHGIGIPEDFKPVLFDEHTKAQRPGLRGEKSHGLGLSIVKRMVELHNGTIWFESEENLGTTFHIEIPKKQ